MSSGNIRNIFQSQVDKIKKLKFFLNKNFLFNLFPDTHQYGLLLSHSARKIYPEDCVWRASNIRATGESSVDVSRKQSHNFRCHFLPLQHMKDKFWNFIFYKFIFVFGIVNVQYLHEIVLWVSWFSALGFLHLMQQLCKDRFEYVSKQLKFLLIFIEFSTT